MSKGGMCMTSRRLVVPQVVKRILLNLQKTCESQDLCYAEDAIIRDFLDAPETRKMLGAESPDKFSLCSSVVGRNFVSHLDKWAHHTQDYVTALLDRGVRVLIYAGTYDWQCNWIANKLWVDKLEWTGSSAYAKETWRAWYVDGEKAGEIKNVGPLTFATVLGAGHMMSSFIVLALTFV